MRGEEADWKDEAFSEYLAHGVQRPVGMLRKGRYKLNYNLGEAPELYDIEVDPNEFVDLAGSAEYAPTLAAMQARLLAEWDPLAIEEQVLRSQRERLLIERAAL